MTWVAWRQCRVPVLGALAALAALVAVLAVTRPELAQLFDHYHADLARCGGNCAAVDRAFEHHLGRYRTISGGLGYLVLAAPALVGAFWGAPLVARELESGTHRLAWTQSVTRTRWLAVKLAVVGLAAAVLAAALGLAVTWWAAPLDRMNADRFGASLFDERGVTPIGYAVLGFAVGVAAGLLLRRTLSAMLLTLAVFVGLHGLVAQVVRPHLIPPVQVSAPITAATPLTLAVLGPGASVESVTASLDLPGAWIHDSRVVDDRGQPPTARDVARACPKATPSPTCIARLGARYHVEVSYTPASRYWTLQAAETGLCLALAGLLAASCLWWLRRRVG